MRAVLAIASIAVLSWLAPVADAQQNGCPPERSRGEKLQNRVFQNLLVALELTVQYAANPLDDENPRPGWLPSFVEWFESTQLSYRRSQQAQEFPNTLNFMLLAKPYKSDALQALSIDAREAWCLIRAGDSVVLRRDNVEHFTRVFLVERNVDKIYFLDPWPDRFLLRGGSIVNMAGKDMVEVSRTEFTRGFVGFETMDTPELRDYFFTVSPARKEDPSTHLSFGHAFLDYGDDRFLAEAEESFREAYRLAGVGANAKTASLAANRLHLSLLLQQYNALAAGDERAAGALVNEIESLQHVHGKEGILSANRAVDNYRLGLRAGSANAIDSAIYFFDLAIALDSDFVDAYIYRALAKSRVQQWDAVVADTTRALQLLGDEIAKIVRTIAARHPGDRVSRMFDESKLAHFKESRALALQLRGTASNLLRKHRQAEHDGLELAKLRPDIATGYAIAGFAALQMDDLVTARERLRQAAQLDKNPQSVALIEDTLRKIEHDPRLH